MMRCLTVDDERPATELLGRFIARTPGLELVGSTNKALEAPALLAALNPDLVFLDIDMPQLSGIALAKLVKSAAIVFTTSFREFAPEAFEVEALDYLLKPIAYERFLMAIQKARRTAPAGHFFAKTGNGQLTRVEIGEILYISALLNYVEIFSKNGKVITYSGITEIMEQLPAERFSRIHRSYIVAHAHIHQVIADEVVLSGGKRLTIGRSYRAAFQEKLRAGLI
ncbi:LytR/AlgR family response regulator transcription factor [Mucilaginibacter sp. AW1-3]